MYIPTLPIYCCRKEAKKSRCVLKTPFPILHLFSAPIHELGERCAPSFRENITWGYSKAPEHFILTSEPCLFFCYYFFFPSATKEPLPKCVFHMFPISHARCLTNLLPVPPADAINPTSNWLQSSAAKFQAAFLKPDPAACLDLKPMPHFFPGICIY